MGCCLTRRRTGSAPPATGFRLGTRLNGAQVSAVKDVHPLLDLRRHAKWSSAQPTRGAAYNWAEMDALANNLLGTDCLGVISYTPAWASSTGVEGNTYPNQADLPLLYDFVRALVAKYKTKIKSWEVYNESDYRGWSAAQYAEVAIGVSAAVRDSDPTARVVTGVSIIVPVVRGGNSSAAWWNALFANPAFMAASDVLSWHIYCRGDNVAPEIGDKHGAIDDIIPASIAKARAAGHTGEIWITESGWNTDTDANPINWATHENQANFLVRIAVMYAAAGINRWYQFQLLGSDTYKPPNQNEAGGMGLWDPPHVGGAKKPSWFAHQTACKFLIGATRVTRNTGVAPGVYLHSFNKSDGAAAWVAWTVAGTASVSIGGLGPIARRTLRDGTVNLIPTAGGVLTFDAGPSPIWIDEQANSGTVVLDTDWSGDWIAKFGAGVYTPSFPNPLSPSHEQVTVSGKTWLRVHYKGGAPGTDNGMFFGRNLTKADGYTVEFSFRMKDGFQYNQMGKLLLGFRGGTVTPGQKPNGTDGFSCRLEWERPTSGTVPDAVAYIYYPDQYMWGGWGDTFHFAPISVGAIHTIKQELVLNTPGQHNGIVRFWLNGALEFEKTNMRFRDIGSLQIDRLLMDTFFGGSAANQGPLRNEYIEFGPVRVVKL